MSNLKRNFFTSLLGLVLSGWGGGMVSVHYLIGNSFPINSINAVGKLIIFVSNVRFVYVSKILMKGSKKSAWKISANAIT